MAANQIARKNDRYRSNMGGCRIVLTASVAESTRRADIIEAVRVFVKFTAENDPWSEHDFGFVVVEGDRFYFKFDYYDSNYEFFQEDGNRVLTIGRADEY